VASLLTVGHIGVALFYVLSGFLNAYNYAAKAREGGRRFLVQCFGRRIARIYPLYLFLLLVTFAATAPLPDALTAFLNVTLLKGFFWNYYFSGIAQARPLTVEETFYLLAPLLFSLTLRFGRHPLHLLRPRL
jgi:peptidoglycan/LPS O-acetylase OafA/YrhL